MTTSRLIMITFLVVVITTSYVVIGDGNDVVYSADAGPVLPNVTYYISFMSSDYNMWICRMNARSTDPRTCPHQPVMFTRPTITPTPVMFILPSSTPDTTVIRESTKLSIKFANPSQCGESGVWRVANGEVVLNGVESREDSLFSIHMTDSYYKFTIGESVYPDVYATSISLSNDRYGKDRLIAKQPSGEMEIRSYSLLQRKQAPLIHLPDLLSNCSQMGSSEKRSKDVMSDIPTFSGENLQKNLKVIQNSRTFLSIIAGVLAGIIGFTGLTGFVFYFVVMLITSVGLMAKAGFSADLYFDSWNRVLFDGFLGGLMSFVLFWTYPFTLNLWWCFMKM
ncbi:hypothetical protein HID58_031877 [Brassica napus]|uniref:ER membrane protein complex subunit 6 n=2 Tax=Brassica TaxID=3705 RepID=A0ABQ8BWJ1_BRANA|nr:hypothetical protein HID58_031877 [Brassica napus]CAG7860014.1 unnamed protein product [Brassica rapa]VDC58513.1 unnamed protein product [Brassica rapa]